jgi:uncharacterized lipoprotein YajG
MCFNTPCAQEMSGGTRLASFLRQPLLGFRYVREEVHMMAKHRSSRILMIAAASLALGACAGNSTQRSAAQYTDDASINTDVQAAVIAVPGVHANNIQVSTYEGVVTLRGNVDDQLAAQNAVQAARQVAGVKKVDYNIKVGQP